MSRRRFLSWLLAPRGLDDARALARSVGGKRVLLTGASFGIGRALALRLGAANAHVILLARTRDQLQQAMDTITAAGGTASVLALDLTDAAAIDAALPGLASQDIDVVIHNAGKSIRRLLAESLDRPRDFQRTMSVNYLGPVRLQLGLLGGMMARGHGHVINVSSVGVRLPPAPRWAAYSASKAAFDHWMQAARPELRRAGIACTSIYLGLVHTRMSAPTAAYAQMPGLTDDEAAAVVCRALVKRPCTIQPWWVAPLRVLAPWFEGTLDRVWVVLLRGRP